MNEAALEAFSFILPIGITLVGVYLAYTGFEAVSILLHILFAYHTAKLDCAS